jgi:UDP-sugar transporter A1/2/3
VFKVVASLLLLALERKEGPLKLIMYLKYELVDNWRSAVLLGVPAGLYTIQNNLLFLALQHLDGTTYQVTYQLKIFTAAIFSVILLGKQLNGTKWVALVVLMAGVVLVQSNQHSGPESTKAGKPEGGDPTFGLICVITACCTSGFAGVYFEKILKGTKQSVWLRNVQLGLFSVILGMIGVYRQDWARVEDAGFFPGVLAGCMDCNHASGPRRAGCCRGH